MSDDTLRAALDESLVAEALFEARIGVPQDAPELAKVLTPPLRRLLSAALAASATDEPAVGCEPLTASQVGSFLGLAASATDTE